MGGFSHGGQSLDELIFCAVEILELFNEKLLQCGDGRHVFVLGSGSLPTKASNNETDEKGRSGEFKRMLFCEVAD